MKSFLCILLVIVISSCIKERKNVIAHLEVDEENNETIRLNEGLYSFQLNWTNFHLDTSNNLISYCHIDCIDISSCCRFDTVDPAYSYIDFDTADLNIDGYTDVIFDFFEPGYSFTAWYTYDKDGHYYSNYEWHIQNPVILDSSRLLFYTYEPIGMDGDFVSQILESRAGTIIGYGYLEYKYFWETELSTLNIKKGDVEVFKELNFADSMSKYDDYLGMFWEENYQFFLE